MGMVSGPSQGHNFTNSEAAENVPPPPILPSERAHCLESFPNGDVSPKGTAKSDFFQQLPPDIRRMIMIEAFGDRIVHVDLRLVQSGRTLKTHATFHGCSPEHSLRETGKTPPFSSANTTPHWRWYGCVCHREPEWRVRNHTIMNNSLSPPWIDGCLNEVRNDGTVDSRRVCEEWSGQEPLKCRIGAMGWLRSCRQAYTEGIEVLYGTNRFNFSGIVLLQNLGHFLLPEHLALIQSAEMVFFGPSTPMARPPDNGQDYSSDKRFSAWYTLTSLMRSVPEALPNLRYLDITPGCRWYPPNMAHNDVLRLVEIAFLQPFDAMVRKAQEKNPRLEEIHTAAPLDMTSLRLLHEFSRVERGPKIRINGHFKDADRLWRSLDCRGGDELAEDEKRGYWISDYVIDRA